MAATPLALTLVRLISFGAMLVGLHHKVLAQCEVGQVREVTVPCISGRMTFPPRTEECILPPADGWFLARADLGMLAPIQN